MHPFLVVGAGLGLLGQDPPVIARLIFRLLEDTAIRERVPVIHHRTKRRKGLTGIALLVIAQPHDDPVRSSIYGLHHLDLLSLLFQMFLVYAECVYPKQPVLVRVPKPLQSIVQVDPNIGLSMSVEPDGLVLVALSWLPYIGKRFVRRLCIAEARFLQATAYKAAWSAGVEDEYADGIFGRKRHVDFRVRLSIVGCVSV